jgi:hypothetical protein
MINYVPVLKSKATTFRALKTLKPDSLSSICPIIEVVPETEFDLVRNLSTFWPKDHPLYIDFLFLDGENKEISSKITGIVKMFIDEGFHVIPVWGPDRSEEYVVTIRSLLDQGITELAVRIPDSVIDPTRASEIIEKTFNAMPLPIESIHAFLDLEDMSGGQEKFYLANAILDLMYRPGIKVCGCLAGAFPDASALQEYKNSKSFSPRYDYKLWQTLTAMDKPYAAHLIYGDYTIRDIDLPFGGFASNIIPTLRYTIDDQFYIHRGISHKKHPDGMNQFNTLCHDLIGETFFRGNTFSDGDRVIFEKGSGQDSSPGNQATWAQIGVNQHIEFVVNQISNPS